MKVALRDDDTSYFTDPDRLEAVYHDVWDRLPVCARRRAARGGVRDKAIPEKYWQADRAFPLEENPALVGAAARAGRRHGRVTIAQHGFTHEDFPGRLRIPGRARHRSALDAKASRTWSSCSSTRIRIFVPPHNALSKRGLRRGQRRRAQPARVVPVVSPVDASVGAAHARQLVARSPLSRGDRPRERRSHDLSARAALPASRRVRLSQPDSGHDASRIW